MSRYTNQHVDYMPMYLYYCIFMSMYNTANKFPKIFSNCVFVLTLEMLNKYDNEHLYDRDYCVFCCV